MTRYDGEYDTVTDSEVSDAAQGLGRIVERNVLAIKLAVFYAVTFAVGAVTYKVVHGPNIEAIVAIWLWFTVIFAALTAILGGFIKTIGAIQRRRHDFE
ncbi:MAG: hypothetical protein ABEH83_04715 [Halobacterium sp.]